MAESSTWVLTFDVVDPKRLRRLSRFLQGHGHRVQKSVFEVLATVAELVSLLDRATTPERFDPALDSLRAYHLCSPCLRATQVRGQGSSPLSARGPMVF